jgi:hypothetical protein
MKEKKRRVSRAVGEELERLAQKVKGCISPADVLEFAKNKNTALHQCFTWDDSEAANRWRLEEAAYLLRFHVTVLPGSNKETRCFVSLTTDRGEEDGSFRLLSRVMKHSEFRAQLLEDAFGEMRTFRRKYSALTELAKVFEAMDDVI